MMDEWNDTLIASSCLSRLLIHLVEASAMGWRAFIPVEARVGRLFLGEY